MQQQDWVLIGLVGAITIVILTKYIFPRNFQAIFSREEYQRIQTNALPFSWIYNLLFYFLISLNMAYFISDSLPIQLIEIPFLNNILIVLLFLFALYLLNQGIRIIILYGMNWTEEFWDYLNYWTFFKIWITWILLILSFCVYYTQYFQENDNIRFYVIMGFVSVSILLIALYQLFRRRKVKKVEWYYYILYLCALEILPILVGCKYLTGFDLIFKGI